MFASKLDLELGDAVGHNNVYTSLSSLPELPQPSLRPFSIMLSRMNGTM
ncbi:MAG: hypothetical protein AB7P03_22725 [Kofleriaceae bacterium]